MRPHALAASLLVLTAVGPVHANRRQAQQLKAAILLKLLSYDRLLIPRTNGAVVIALVTDSGNPERRASLLSVFGRLAQHKVQDRKIRVVPLHLVGRDLLRLGKMLDAAGANLLYVARNARPETAARAIAEANRRRVPMVSGALGPLRAGAALAIQLVDGKPRIFANLEAMRRQRISLPAAVLQLATVVVR